MRWFRSKVNTPEAAPNEAAVPATTKDHGGDASSASELEAGAEGKAGAARTRPSAARGPRRRSSTASTKKATDAEGGNDAEGGGGEGEAEGQQPAPRPRARRRRAAAAAPARPAGDSGDGTEPEAAAEVKPEVKPEAKRQPRARRRTATPRRSALPAVRKEMLISHGALEQRVAILEDSTPVEVYLGRPGRQSVAGNIYLGVVDTVLPGMEASFVEIGLEKNGFLYVDEIVVPELEGRRHGRRIQDLIKKGETVLVQAVKDPMGTKGARLTTEISLPGRFLVYVPFGDGIGVSRRLDDDERERLKTLCRGLELQEGGIIVRTAAEGASEAELAGDLAFLRKLWATIQGRAERATAPSLVYREADLPLRVVRDLFTSDFERLAVDHERTYRRVVGYLKRTSPELARRVERYRDAEPLMERSGVDAAVESTLQRRVDLPSGGYLVFDYAEAFTVIDVNTGRFVGARGKNSQTRLEDTITKNNLEATKEIVRQLRLRDIGGIIVIDFIDMANPKNRHDVEEALKRELERDRTKTYVVEISPLGLVEMTRQNVTDGPREILTTRCSTCSGNGVVISEETYAVQAERAVRRLAKASSAEALLVELPASIAAVLIGPAGSRLAEIEAETEKRLAFEARDDVPPNHVALLAEGTASEIEPKGLPVAPGDELELRLSDRHLRYPEDAIARLDGYVVCVAGAGGNVGDTVRVRIERATRTAAYARVAGAPELEGPVDLDHMAEQEHEEHEPEELPKKRTRRGTRGGRGRARAAGGGPTPGQAAEPEATAELEEPAEAAIGGPPARRRRAPARAAAPSNGTVEAAAEAPSEATAVERAGEPVEAPGGEAVEGQAGEAAAAEKPKKRTRRGTRGGRGRRKATAPSAGEAAGAAETSEPLGVPVLEGGEAFAEGSADVASEAKKEGGQKAAGEKRPRRAASRKAVVSPGADNELEAEPGAPPTSVDVGPEAASAAAAPEAGDGAGEEGAERPRKRTRRGTRGGRGRRRPTSTPPEAVAADSDGG